MGLSESELIWQLWQVTWAGLNYGGELEKAISTREIQ